MVTGTPCVSSNTRREQVGRLDRLPAGAAGVVQRQLEDELRRRRHAQVAPGKRRHHVQVFLDRLQHRVGIQLHVAHHFGERVPLHLGEREEDVLVGEQRVLAAAGLLDRAVDDPLRRFGDFARRDVEIFNVHDFLRRREEQTHARR